MSSISGRALKRLQRLLPELRLCKDVLVIPPTDHIVRGFTFEYTPYKGLFYFWRTVFPLYTSWPFIVLNYSDRANGDYIDLSDAEFDRSIARLVDFISGELADLRSIHDPETFLVRFGGPSSEEGYAARMGAFDAAMTYYLVGKIEFSLNALEYLAGADLAPGGMDILASWRALLREMRIDPSACGRHIAELEAANIRRFALEPTISREKATDQVPLTRKPLPTQMNSDKLADRAHKRLHKALPELRLGFGMLFLPPVDRVVDCFALESGRSLGDRACFWRVVMPLYRPRGFVLVLNYGERLLEGESVSLLEADLDRTVDRLAQAVRKELDLPKRVRTPKDFLQHVKWDEQPNSPNYRIDLALTHYLVGDAPACREVLDELLARPPNPWWAKERELVGEMARELDQDPAALTRRIEAWEQSAKRSLQIIPRPRRRRVQVPPGISARFA